MGLAQHAFLPRHAGCSVLGAIGSTPLLRLHRISADFPGVEILAKAEFLNPGGSVKDRPALSIIEDGERSGRLHSGRTILDATSGNTGIAYAMIGAAKGYPVKLCLPANASRERKRILKAYGAEVILTDPGQGSDGAILCCRELHRAHPELYFYADQYNNPANWRAHFETTGPEIIRQTEGQITHFVAMLGTSGTFTGVSRRFRRDLPDVECISAQPASGFHGIEGAKHMPTAIVPGIYDPSLADDNLWIETEEAHRMTRRLARDEGLLAGISAGANIAAAAHVARDLASSGQTGTIVTILCDGGDKYLSDDFWDDPD